MRVVRRAPADLTLPPRGGDLGRIGANRALEARLLVTADFHGRRGRRRPDRQQLALLADAGHMLSDTFSLASRCSRPGSLAGPAAPKRTFGFRRAEILAALSTGSRWSGSRSGSSSRPCSGSPDPPEVEADLMLAIALVGLAVNVPRPGILQAHGREPQRRGGWPRARRPAGTVGAVLAALIILATAGSTPTRGRSGSASWSSAARGHLRDSTWILLEAHRWTSTSRRSRSAMPRCRGRGGPRPARVDDHLRLPGARRARPRPPRHGPPSDPLLARSPARPSLRARAHHPSGGPRGRRVAADRHRSHLWLRGGRAPVIRAARRLRARRRSRPAGRRRDLGLPEDRVLVGERPPRRGRAGDRGVALPRAVRPGRGAGGLFARGHRLRDLRVDR